MEQKEEQKEKQKKETKKIITSRVFTISQHLINSNTKEKLIDEEQVKNGLSYRTIKKWAYILHDKDTYTEDDLIKYKKKNNNQEPTWKIGDKKVSHYHIVIKSKRPMPLSSVAKWFDVPEETIKKRNGRGAFEDCVEYLTHESPIEQAKGKYLYNENEVKCNFNFRQLLKSREEILEKYGDDLTEEEKIRVDVMYHGKTLKECEEEDPLLFEKLHDRLKKNRLYYITHKAPSPSIRINIFIEGRASMGKDHLALALARLLFPTLKDDNDIVFPLGSGNVSFEGYDGQPVIIWSDKRPKQILEAFKGKDDRGSFYAAFSTFPSVENRQNIKGSSIKLTNAVNIITSPIQYRQFLDELAGVTYDWQGRRHEPEDISQAYRRFPIILVLRENDFDCLVNKGFLNDKNEEFLEYILGKRLRGNMAKLCGMCGKDKDLLNEASKILLEEPVNKINELRKKGDKRPTEEEKQKIREIIKDWGKPIEDEEEDPFENLGLKIDDDFDEKFKQEDETLTKEVEKNSFEEQGDAFDEIPDMP